MDSEFPPKEFAKTAGAASKASLILLVAWCGAAQGATESVVRCDKQVRDLTSLKVSSEALSVSTVDHTNPEDLETQTETTEANAPFLYLAPRVANLLRDVFQMAEEDKRADMADEAPSSPVADSVDNNAQDTQRDGIEPAIRSNDEILPRYQLQMYRKDI